MAAVGRVVVNNHPMKSLLLVVACLGCGGSGKDGPTTPGSNAGSAAKPAAAGDVSLEIPNIEIKGLMFEPEALGRPGMPLYEPKNKRLTIAQQKVIFGNTKSAVDKQAQGAVLATMIYLESKKQTGDAAKKMVEEARQVLRTAQAAAGKDVDEITYRLLGSYELFHDDYAAAEKAWEGLVTVAPKSKELLYNKAWWVHSLLKQYKNTEALAIVKNEQPSDKQPELSYVMAWAKWRAGDDAGAWQAIVAAASGWGNSANKDVLQRDLLLFAGRSNVPLAQVTPELYKIFGAKTPTQQYEVVAKLGLQSYQFAGKWSEGVAALDEAQKLAGSAVPPNDKVVIKYYQADFTVRLDQPEAASRHAKESLLAMPACPKCTEKEKQDIVTGIYGIARLFHLLYATANDIRYYQPAHDLYAETIPLIQDATLRKQAQSDLATLQQTLKNTKVGTGTHEKQAIGVLLGRHNQEIQACYEETLAANPKLAGTLTLTLESDASGEIKGAATEPKAGTAELSAVAGCALANAKTWKLPKRGMAGNTRIKLVYALSKK
jgi:formaldehyde-activating enzyme involved in methanogenesis